MNSETTRRIILILLLAYLLSGVVLFSQSILSFSSRDVLPGLFWKWIVVDTAAGFITLLLPVHCAAVILAYALLFSLQESRKSRVHLFGEIIQGPLVLFMILLGGYVVLQEAVLPSLQRARGEYRSQTVLARQFMQQAEDAERRGRTDEARRRLTAYLAVDPGNDAARIMMERVERVLQEEASEEESTDEPGRFASIAGLVDMSAAELYETALDFRKREDPFSAHYYATLAAQVDGAWTDPKRLAAELWKEIENRKPSPHADLQAQLFARKREAYLTLVMAKDPVGAYFQFLELSRQFPNDLDAKTYLSVSREEAASVSFFRDEIEEVEHLPGKRNVTFINGRQADGYGIVSFDRMIRFRDYTWFIGIRAAGFSGGEVRYLLTAPYGKLIGNRLVMRCLDRDDRDTAWIPEYLVRKSEPEFPDIIPLDPAEADLSVLGYGRTPLGEADVLTLWRATGLFRRYGLSGGGVEFELIRRLLLPFSFIIFSLLSALIGFRLRSRYLVHPVSLSLLLVPILPVVCFGLIHLVQWAQHLAIGTVLAYAGLPAALIVLPVMQGALLLMVLLFMAGQRV